MKIYSWFNILIVLTSSLMTTAPVIAGLFDRPDFFEQGQDQFEEEIRKLEQGQSTPNSSLTVDETAIPWSRVVIKEGGFTVMMPSGTITKETETIEAPKGRKIEDDWRFLKSAIDDWLRSRDSRSILLTQAGALADDNSLVQLRENIYQARGRSEIDENLAER